MLSRIEQKVADLFRERLMLLGFVLGLVWWLFDCLVDSRLVDHEPFLEQLMSPASNEIIERICFVILLTAFGAFSQRLLRARRKSERDLRESEQRFYQLTDNLNEIFWFTEGEGKDQRVIYVSPAYERVFGRSPEALYRQEEFWSDAIHEEERARIIAAFDDGVLKGVLDQEYRIVRPDGSIRWIHDRGYPVRNEPGSPCRCAGIAEDITERKIIEEQLKRAQDELEQRVRDRTAHLKIANQELEQANRERMRHQAELTHVSRLVTVGELSTGLAHELNQPLTSIANYSDACIAACENGRLDFDELLDSLHRISEQAVRAGQIISRLRRMVQKGPPRRSTVNLNELVRDAIELIQPQGATRTVGIRLDLDPELNVIRADHIQIEQVILNLVRNGIDAMDATECEPRRIDIRTKTVDDGVELTVRDYGIGVPPDLSRQLFEPFVSSKQQGLGIGLAISRTIIHAHKGRIWHAPAPDGGTSFHFWIPEDYVDLSEESAVRSLDDSTDRSRLQEEVSPSSPFVPVCGSVASSLGPSVPESGSPFSNSTP